MVEVVAAEVTVSNHNMLCVLPLDLILKSDFLRFWRKFDGLTDRWTDLLIDVQGCIIKEIIGETEEDDVVSNFDILNVQEDGINVENEIK